jgi:hypothetical protein
MPDHSAFIYIVPCTEPLAPSSWPHATSSPAAPAAYIQQWLLAVMIRIVLVSFMTNRDYLDHVAESNRQGHLSDASPRSQLRDDQMSTLFFLA